MGRLLIQKGRVIDPSQGLDRVMDLFIEEGHIATYDAGSAGPSEVIDASGLIVAPGLFDMHVQLREPGFEEDETIQSGTAAALVGGFSSIACLPETDPPLDTQASVEFVRQKAARAANCNVFVIACVSKNREGNQLAELGTLVEAGAIAFSDAQLPIRNAELLRRALEYCLMFDKPILDHAEVEELSRGGIMHEGLVSLLLGLTGMPADAEDVMTGRDLRLADSTGGRIHMINVSSAGSIDLIRRAKTRGVRVSAGICTANFCFTDEALRTFDSSYKVNPPLRAPMHVDACIAGLVDGTIDVICSGHAPRAPEKKMRELDQAPFGISAIETALACAATFLIAPGHLNWMQVIEKMSTNPARILGTKKGTLQIGADADVTIIDPAERWIVDPEQFRSQSGNTPLRGCELTGRAQMVIVNGEIRFRR